MGLGSALIGVYGKNDVSKPPPPFDFLSEINNRLKIERVVPPYTDDHVFRASELSRLFCARREALRRKHNVVWNQTYDAKVARTFQFGHAFHKLVQDDWFGKWGWLYGDWRCDGCGEIHRKRIRPEKCERCECDVFHYLELKYENKVIGLTGHPDGILCLPDGEEKILEIKTASSHSYRQILQKSKPLESHYNQVQIYMFMTGITKSVILYFDKDESLMTDFHIDYRKETVDKILSEIRAYRSGSIPERVVCDKYSCARARGCPVREYCFGRRG